jgi:hypothetical protein
MRLHHRKFFPGEKNILFTYHSIQRNETVRKNFAALGLIAATLAAANAHADVNVIGEVGTTGVGFHASVPLRPDLNARFGTGYLNYKYNGSTRSLDYDLKLKANTFDALLDWYPSRDSIFRLSAGLAYNGNKIDVNARPNVAGAYVLQGNVYNAASVGTVQGKVEFNKVAPYFGVGWGRPSEKENGWSFSTDMGVLFQGSPKTTLTSSGCSAPAAMCNQLAADIAQENKALNDEASKFKFYPVLRVGVSYKF